MDFYLPQNILKFCRLALMRSFSPTAEDHRCVLYQFLLFQACRYLFLFHFFCCYCFFSSLNWFKMRITNPSVDGWILSIYPHRGPLRPSQHGFSMMKQQRAVEGWESGRSGHKLFFSPQTAGWDVELAEIWHPYLKHSQRSTHPHLRCTVTGSPHTHMQKLPFSCVHLAKKHMQEVNKLS